MGTQTKKPRNNVLDLMRGYFLLAILTNHMSKYPSAFDILNGRGGLWVSAAEGFVFISGLLIGVVNFKKIDTLGFSTITKKILKRAGLLYIASIVLTTAYSLIGLHLGRWPYMGFGIQYQSTWQIIKNAVLLQYSYGWADLLLFYTVLLALTPLIFFVVYKGYTKTLLLASFLVWLYGFITPGEVRYLGSYFPLVSWQFLFVIGIIIGINKQKIADFYQKNFFYASNYIKAIVFLIFAISVYLSTLDSFYSSFTGAQKEFIDLWFNKLSLGPARIALFFVWFTVQYWLFTILYVPIKKYFGWLLLKFGRNSLLTYVVQSAVLFAFYYVSVQNNFIKNTLVNIVAILLVWALVTAINFLDSLYKLPIRKV